MQNTTNNILNGKIKIIQPKKGYRAAIDPILLAASVLSKKNESVLDVGCGVGTALLALAHRVKDINITGLEIQPNLAKLALQNSNINNLQDRINIINDDLHNPDLSLQPNHFNHVMSNPPYFIDHNGQISPYPNKAISNCGAKELLQSWVSFCIKYLKPRGYAHFIFTSTRIDELLAIMQNKLGDVRIYPLWPNANKPSKLVIVQGRKSVKSPAQILPGMIMHKNNGKHTKHLNNVLIDGKGIEL